MVALGKKTMAKKLKNNDMLQYLPDEDKSRFLDDLLSAIEESKRSGNFDAIDQCIDDWEDTVELLSIPGFKERTWENYNRLKAAGVIKG